MFQSVSGVSGVSECFIRELIYIGRGKKFARETRQMLVKNEDETREHDGPVVIRLPHRADFRYPDSVSIKL